jgi:hypothetical protein
MPGAPGQPQPGMPPYPAPGQPYPQQNPNLAPGAAAIPGQPPLPPYQMPANRNKNQASDLPPPPDAPSTPYDFFMQPKPAMPLNPLPVSGKHLGNYPGKPDNTNKNKFIMLIAGAAGLILILILISVFAPKNPAPTQLFGLAQTQQEIIRLCTQGGTKAKYRSTRYFAVTCSTGLTSSQKQLLAYMSKAGYGYNAKQLGLKASSQADSRLKGATSSSTYDDVFRDILEADLTSYDRALTAQLGTTTSSSGSDVLNQNQHTAELLIKMVRDDSDKTEAAPVES